jgi:hypothetical protein
MYDEMMDYPQNFTVGQLVTFYHNLNNAYEDKGEKSKFTTYPQDREKMRRAIKALDNYKVSPSEYADLQESIDNYRFVPITKAKGFIEALNRVLAPYRPDQSRLGLTFKDKLKTTGADLLKSDAIVEADGTILEIVSIAQDEDDSESLDVYVKRGDKTAYMEVKKSDDIVVYRGSGVLPTPENLAQDARIKKGLKPAQGKQAEILDGDGEGSEDSSVTEGKKEPKDVKSPIQDRFIPVMNGLLARYEITD